MKQIILSVLLMMLPLVASAETAKIDGIYYKFNSETRTAEVTNDPDNVNNKYSGSVVIPETVIYRSARYSVTSIVGAFSGCTDLISVTIPESVVTIGNSAFGGCAGLTSLTIPNSVTTIGNSAFARCTGLTSLTIPNSVTSIGESAFSGCSGLTSVTFGSGVTSIGRDVFRDCSSLTSVTIIDLKAWCNISFGSSFPSHHIYMDGQEVTHLVIPDGVTSISEYAFLGCIGLTSVTIPNSVTYIGENAFMKCTGLTSLTIPNSVVTIDHEAFEDCSGLNYIVIGNGVTTIGGEAFKDCDNLNYVVIGSGVTTIWGQAFGNNNKLTDVYCYAETVPTTDETAFKRTYIENATLHVPVASVDAYKTTEPWSGFGTIVGFDGSVDPRQPISKCEAPTISFVDGELTFTCPTEGVEYVCEIKSADAKIYNDRSVVLTNKYIVSVYAIKEGYENSETVTKEIIMGGNSGGEGSGLPGDLNGDGIINTADVVKLVNIILDKE